MDAAHLIRRLGGHRAGNGWIARCPAHDDRTPSLSICDAGGKVLVYCHAGCHQADVIAALRRRGLWGHGHRGVHLDVDGRRHHQIDGSGLKRTRAALAIWQSAKWPRGTLVERYLASRALTLKAPPALRFHPALAHPSGDMWPAMVALVTGGSTGQLCGIHRTFLSRDGCAKAPVEPKKMAFGPIRGGAVQLADPDDGLLMVSEGIETALSAMQATGLPAWAALSTSGMRALELPPGVRDVIVLADGDDPGEAAARDCAYRWLRQGRSVHIARPGRGLDFNDLLTEEAA